MILTLGSIVGPLKYSVYISGWLTSAPRGMTCGVLLAALQQTTAGYRSPACIMAGGAPARHPEIYRGYVQ
ncbi:hypothetical protein Y032_0177g604 [Ancylostoma ceylanicum]|uniref:Uncharacterized protein n=1 Tax=Ancylostoma ceylanicum TaxID=53326 RepID=A0A016SUB0_9BILA|nr:hypothetical protein Y032_0177g604 [Ancylostoma ceylanicum]